MAIFPCDFLSEDFLILQLKEGKKEEEREGIFLNEFTLELSIRKSRKKLSLFGHTRKVLCFMV